MFTKTITKNLLLFISFIVVVPRLPIVLRDYVHYDAGAEITVLDASIKAGHYVPSRHPGSILAEMVFSLLRMLGEWVNIPPYLFTNGLCLLASIGTLYFGYKILLRWFPIKDALLTIAIFNFQPQMFIFGGATADITLLLFFMTYSVYLFYEGKIAYSILIAWIGCFCKIQGLALLVPLLGYWAFQKNFLYRAALSALLLVIVMLPGFSYFGFSVFNPGIHANTITYFQKLVAAVYRLINSWGIIGFPLLVILLCHKLRSAEFRRHMFTSIVAWMTLFTLVIFRFAPMEAHYLLPVVFVAIVFWMKFYRELPFSKYLQIAMVISILLSNFVQVRIRPWKAHFIEIYPGVIQAHFNEQWVIKGGG